MSPEEIEKLTSPEIRKMIEEAIEIPPERFAFQHHGENIPVTNIAGQLKSLQRAKSKLPKWYAARCILPPRAYEQASSEDVAKMKPLGNGLSALDLTCGLGVDAVEMAGRFKQVVAIDADPGLTCALRHNLEELNIINVSVRNTLAEKFAKNYSGKPFDLVYVDPDRRDAQGRRRFALEDCSPNIRDLREDLLRIGKRVLVKLSPMLDLTAIEQELRPVKELTVLASGNECKELLVELGSVENTSPSRRAIFNWKGKTFDFVCNGNPVPSSAYVPASPSWIYEPDVSLYKAGIANAWMAENFPNMTGGMPHPDAYIMEITRLKDFPGREFRVLEMFPYKPKAIKKMLKSRKIRKAHVSRRHFDIPVKSLREELGLKEGGTNYLLFSRMPNGQRMAYWCERVQ